MKTIRLLNFNFLFFFLTLFSLTSIAQSYTESKNMHFTFPVLASGEVNISNKYGDIMVVPGNSDSVVVDIAISATEKKQADAMESLSRIDVKNASSRYMVNLETLFKGSKNDWRTDVSMMASDLFNSVKKIKINYTVYVPENMSITLSNRYGNVFMESHKGRLNLYLENGDFRAGQLSGKVLINHSYGNSTIQMLKDGQLSLNFVNFSVDEANVLQLVTRSSDMVIGKINEAIIDSRKDKWNIRNINIVSGSGYFSTMVLGTLQAEISATLSYGDFSVQKINDSVRKVSIIGDYNNTILPFVKNKDLFYDLDFSMVKSVLPVPSEWSTDTINAEKKIFHYRLNDQGTRMFYIRQVGGRFTLLP